MEHEINQRAPPPRAQADNQSDRPSARPRDEKGRVTGSSALLLTLAKKAGDVLGLDVSMSVQKKDVIHRDGSGFAPFPLR
jgi:hypothetical protein